MKKLLFGLAFLTATFANAQNDNCSVATSLTVGNDFTSGAITVDNTGATTDGNPSSCNSESEENIWFKVTVPPSGNVTIETAAASGSLFDDSVLTVYSGSCGTLTEIDCNDDKDIDNEDYFSLISLSGQVPGTTLYISVWKYSSDTDSGQFKISAYDSSNLSTNEVYDNKKRIQIYPNPFSKELSIADISEVKGISVTDTSGKEVKNIGKLSNPIDLSDLVKGIYFITLKMNNGTLKTTKIIKK